MTVKKVGPCRVCGEVKANEGYGYCGRCRYWARKGLTDEGIRQKIASKNGPREIERACDETTPSVDTGLWTWSKTGLLPESVPVEQQVLVNDWENFQVHLDFSKHPEILAAVMERAKAQMRLIEMQIIWEVAHAEEWEKRV